MTSAMENAVARIPEEAVAAAMRVLADANRPLGGYENRVEDALRQALPALHRDLRNRLLGDEAVEAVARLQRGGSPVDGIHPFDYLDGEEREWGLEDAKRSIEAALNTVLPEEPVCTCHGVTRHTPDCSKFEETDRG